MKRNLMISLSLLLAFMLLFSACSTLKDAAELTEYDFDTDKIASINHVIGAERKVTGVSSGTNNGMKYKEYTYETASTAEDLSKYFVSLMEQGWLAITDYDFTADTGEAKLAANSADEGNILVLTAAFQANEYTIRVEKGEGTLTAKQ